MKKKFIVAVFISALFYSANGQLPIGGFHANFGIDADTRSGFQKYGPAVSATGDDWFVMPGAAGRGVIDTTGAGYYRTQLQAGRNISFKKSMARPMFSKVDGRLWMDAVYIRDYTISSGRDSTTFRGGDKNGHNPATWNSTIGKVPPKIDIIDAFAHFRRDGLNIEDSLWFFTGVSTLGVEGDRYYDIELYRNNMSYNHSTGMFTTAGLSNGHTEWIFDPLGNIVKSGDIILAVSYEAGQAPLIEVRIWVSRTTFTTANPRLFKFASDLDGTPLSGYVTIVSKDGTSRFGSGIANFSTTAQNDSTYSTPWGSNIKNQGWMPVYESLHFMELGINFSRIGIDPSLYNEVGKLISCGKLFSTIFIKSRASTAFTAELHDFVGPASFETPAMNFNVKSDTITCRKPEIYLAVDNASVGSYSWSTVDGSIIDNSSDNSVITVNKKGTYQVMSRFAPGCPTVRTDRIRVEKDDFLPTASADIALTDDGLIQLIGGDTAKSNVQTPFGKSKGLSWSWKGPNDFRSNEQNPVINDEWAWGAYYLTITEARNGCEASAAMDISFRNMPKKPAGNTVFLSEKGTRLTLSTVQSKETAATVVVYSANGQVLGKRLVYLIEGQNDVELPVEKANQVRIVSLFIGKEMVLTRKTIF